MAVLKQPYENLWPGAWAVVPCWADEGELGMNGRVEVAVRKHMAWGLGSGALLGR
jgi:hypothetical protein